MKQLMLAIALSAALTGCSDKGESSAKPTSGTQAAVDVDAGKVLAERECKGCHGLEGRGTAPGIPHLAAQSERYLLASMKAYQDGKRTHAALRDMAGQMSEADLHNVLGDYASLPPLAISPGPAAPAFLPYENGKALATACAKCHGEDGNAKLAGTPSLAGQQPHYLVAAIQEYHQGDRAKDAMRSSLRESDKLELESLALYFAAQTPVKRAAATRGDAAAGEPGSAMCGGCHGAHGVSVDAATPSLAGQDAEYLVKATKAYRTTRKNWGMQRYIAGLGDKDIENIVAYYTAQTPRAADKVPTSTQELAAKCDRCHDQDATPTMAAPKMKGQDKDYLVMALRAYRDDKRDSSTMHRMSFPYSNAIIESLASWYAHQPAK